MLLDIDVWIAAIFAESERSRGDDNEGYYKWRCLEASGEAGMSDGGAVVLLCCVRSEDMHDPERKIYANR